MHPKTDRLSGELIHAAGSPGKADSFDMEHLPVVSPCAETTAHSKLQITNPLVSEVLAEIMGTFMIIVMGDACVAAAVMANGDHGNPVSIGIGWGLAVTLAIMTTGSNSPAHLNPAITITNAVYGRFPWKKVVPYVVAQIFAGWLAAACVYISYINYFPDFGYNDTSATIFTTLPKPGVSNAISFFVEFIGTMILMFVVYSTADAKNTHNEKNSGPIIVGASVALLVFAFQCVNGIALNPARDMGPRIFISMAGWGSDAFTYNSYYFWIPSVATTLGAIFGGGIYILMIENAKIEKQD